MSSTRGSKVVKLEDATMEMFSILAPTSLSADRRFSMIRGPMIQTRDMTMTSDGEACTIVCTPEYADFIAGTDAHFAALIAESSLQFFGKAITHEQVERRFAETIHGHRTPKHIVACDRCCCFTKDLQPYVAPPPKKGAVENQDDGKPSSLSSTRSIPEVATCQMILKCEGIVFEERRCFAQWSVCQMRVTQNHDEDDDDDLGEEDDDEVSMKCPVFLE